LIKLFTRYKRKKGREKEAGTIAGAGSSSSIGEEKENGGINQQQKKQ